MANVIAGTSPPLSSVSDLAIGDVVRLPGTDHYATVTAIEPLPGYVDAYAVSTDSGTTRRLAGREYAEVKLPTGLSGVLGF